MEPNNRHLRLMHMKALILAVLLTSSPALLAGCGSEGPASDSSGDATDVYVETAVVASREQIADTGANLTDATLSYSEKAVGSSDTDETCDSGSVLRVELFGSFPQVAVSPPLGGTDTEVTEMDLTVDAKSGKTCLVSVSTGETTPDVKATHLLIEEIAGWPRSVMPR